MKRHFVMTAGCLLLASIAGFSAETAATPAGQVVEAVRKAAGAAEAGYNAWVGSEACLACHSRYGEYRETLHATGLKSAETDVNSMKTKYGIIADYDRNKVDDFTQGLDFNKISSAFDQFKPNAPVLAYGSKGYSIRIGRVEYPVATVHGGSGLYKQRFLVRIPVTDTATGLSAGLYYSPVQYNEANNAYVVYEPTYWYNADNTPKITGPMAAKDAAAGKSFVKGCSGCHATTLTTVGKDKNGEFVATTPTPVYVPPGSVHYLDVSGKGEPEMYNIGCERCHGPGARHIMATWDKGRIVNPGKEFTPMQQNFQCGSCHSRGASMPSGTHEFPYDEKTGEAYPAWAPTPDLFTRYLADKPGVHPDGKTSRQHHQQLQDLMKSSKWEYPYHKVTCIDCHDPHKPTKAQIRETLVVDSGAKKLTLAVKVNDNSLCLGCHAGFGPFETLTRDQIGDMAGNRTVIGQVVSAHTRHPYNPEGTFGVSRCTTCHMATMASSGAPYDMHSHTFEVVPPERTIKFRAATGGTPNSCATCHRQTAQSIGAPADTSLTTWNEASDIAVAEWLMKYYGPDGAWWKTPPTK
ncbi:MAG: cytochrome c3 family protein [Bryobacteraceae bacterium]|nr:cytochrome c3 family protein [Bryobacteraceae bacterium]